MGMETAPSSPVASSIIERNWYSLTWGLSMLLLFLKCAVFGFFNLIVVLPSFCLFILSPPFVIYDLAWTIYLQWCGGVQLSARPIPHAVGNSQGFCKERMLVEFNMPSVGTVQKYIRASHPTNQPMPVVVSHDLRRAKHDLWPRTAWIWMCFLLPFQLLFVPASIVLFYVDPPFQRGLWQPQSNDDSGSMNCDSGDVADLCACSNCCTTTARLLYFLPTLVTAVNLFLFWSQRQVGLVSLIDYEIICPTSSGDGIDLAPLKKQDEGSGWNE